jgi:hypothetical protein
MTQWTAPNFVTLRTAGEGATVEAGDIIVNLDGRELTITVEDGRLHVIGAARLNALAEGARHMSVGFA